MTTRMLAIGGALLLLTGCNAIKLLSGDRAGLPCSVEEGCGAGFACVDGACVADGRDGGVDASGQDAASADAHGTDTLSSDSATGDGAAADSSTSPPWDLTLTGTGFMGMSGNMASAVVVDANGTRQSAVQSVGISNGSFSFTWTDVLNPGIAYSVHVFFDATVDGLCDPTDPQFNVAVGTATGDRQVAMLPTLPQATVCQSFDDTTADAGSDGGAQVGDLHVNGSGFGSYLGQTLHLELFAGTPPGLAASDTLVITGASFTKTLSGVLDGTREYTLSWWFDSDATATCSQDDLGAQVYLGTPGADHTQVIAAADAEPYGCLNTCDLDKDAVESSAAGCTGNDCDDNDAQRYPGNVDVCDDSIDQDCSGDDANCPRFSLHLDLSGFAANADFDLLVYYNDAPGDPEGVRTNGSTDANGDARVDSTGILVSGHSYTLLLFFDNGDGICSIVTDAMYEHHIDAVTGDVTVVLHFNQMNPIGCGPIIQFQLASGPWGNHNLIFVTSGRWNGDLGGPSGADTICQDAASAAGLPAQGYKAWLSTDLVQAANRLSVDRGWVRPDGKPFALSQAELVAGRILMPPAIDELGVLHDVSYPVYTGTTASGEVGQACSGWISAQPGMSGTFGTMIGGTGAWTSYSSQACDNDAHLYCLGDLPTAGAVQPPGTAGLRRAFVSVASWTPSAAGMTSADSLCAGEANAEGLTGSFVALLAATNASAAQRLTTGLNWVRVDGALLLDGQLAGLASGFQAPLNVTADGTYLAPGVLVWTGGALDATAADTDNCSGWFSAQPAASGMAGSASLSGGSAMTQQSLTCNTTTARLYCFEL